MTKFGKIRAPYPKPFNRKIGLFRRLVLGGYSWIHTLYKNSYTMKMGTVKLPKLCIHIINDPKIANEILTDKDGKYPKHRVQHEMLCPLLGDSVFSTNGEVWLNQRKMINPAFAHASLRKTFPVMVESARETVDFLRTQEGNILIDPVMTHVTADIIFRTILSSKLSMDEALSIHKSFNQYQSLTQKITSLKTFGVPAGVFNFRLKKYSRKIHGVFASLTHDRYHSFDPTNPLDNDILDSLLAAQHPKTGKRFSFDEIIDQLSIIFLAGHETSASALTWALYLIGQCDHLQQVLYDEISDEVVGGDISYESLRQLHHLSSVFKESLRLYPPVSFLPREAACPMSIRKKNVDVGDMLSISPWLMHRNGGQWDNPHDFDGSRFLGLDKSDSYMPFGKGKRICIGAGFAQQEALIILSYIVYNFHINTCSNHPVDPVSRMTTKPKKGVKLSFTPRHI